MNTATLTLKTTKGRRDGQKVTRFALVGFPGVSTEVTACWGGWVVETIGESVYDRQLGQHVPSYPVFYTDKARMLDVVRKALKADAHEAQRIARGN